MIVETAQLLSSAHKILDGDDAPDGLYQTTHEKHPCSIWVRESSENYAWLYEHFVALCDQYTKRYGKVHATDQKMRIILKECPRNIVYNKLTEFPQCMPDEYKVENDAVQAYRNYYNQDKSEFAKWEKGVNPPSWWNPRERSEEELQVLKDKREIAKSHIVPRKPATKRIWLMNFQSGAFSGQTIFKNEEEARVAAIVSGYDKWQLIHCDEDGQNAQLIENHL